MNNIRRIRAMLGISQAELAKVIDMTQGNISHYELGQEVPPNVARKIISIASDRGVVLTFDDIYSSNPHSNSLHEAA